MENYEFKKYKFLKAYMKVTNYKLKKIYLKAYTKMEKIIKFGDIEIHKQTFHQHKEPISKKNVDIDKIVVSNKFFLVKKDLNTLLATKVFKN